MKEILELSHYPVVTLIGSGGKTSTMYYLANEMMSEGKKVLITTTTRIFYLSKDRERLITAIDYFQWEKQLELKLKAGNYLVAGQGIKNGKVLGIPPEWVDKLTSKGIFDLILVEGDGSRQRPLKAPAQWEPVIPPSTSLLLTVIGLQGIGKPLSNTVVHREENFSRLTGLKLGEVIKPEDLCQIFFHPEGYNLTEHLKTRKVVPIFNQADGNLEQELALKLAKCFSFHGIGLTLITAHNGAKVEWRVINERYNSGNCSGSWRI